MPHDAVIERQDPILKSGAGQHDMTAVTSYEAPCGPDGEVLHDPYKAMDQANQKWMADTLLRHYPGHFWSTKHDGAQRMAYVSIPILMGVNKYWAVNLMLDTLSEALLVRMGGEILERYGLRRGRLELTPFLEAREKHSALVMPSRKVPE